MWLGVGFVSSFFAISCGGPRYSFRITSVESKVEAAHELGAETYAPYQYYSARERVVKAREQAAHAHYGDALELLDKAEDFAQQAIAQTESVKKGAGR